MKIAFISDIHANLEALEKVIRDSEKQGVEKIHFLGDTVGYGCNPNECINLVKKHCDLKLIGNHDYAAMGLESIAGFNQVAQTSILWTTEKLIKKAISILSDFEMEATFLDYRIVHATPESPENWNYILNSEQALSQFEYFSESICFVGHSHLPTVFELDPDKNVTTRYKEKMELNPDNRYIINVGSVGQPRDNDPRACYLVIDNETNKISFRRVEYDIKKTQRKMRKAMLPDFLVERLSVGR
jgi:diadenosine tetraphosphatase ApaH/serine/threonine PP2A family protein phosphatase